MWRCVALPSAAGGTEAVKHQADKSVEGCRSLPKAERATSSAQLASHTASIEDRLSCGLLVFEHLIATSRRSSKWHSNQAWPLSERKLW